MPIPKAFASYFHFYQPLTKRCSLVCPYNNRVLVQKVAGIFG